MKITQGIAAFLVFSILVQPAAFAGQKFETKQNSVGARSIADLEDSFLRSTRLLQQKQEMQQLQEAAQSAARPGVAAVNDTYYKSGALWGIQKIGLSDAVWNLYQGQNVTIAVVDTGVLMNHEDIAANIWTNPNEIAGNGIDDDGSGFADDVRGWDFVDDDNNATDLNGHGSHVAGIAAAASNNKGIIGVAPRAKIIPVRVLNRAGSGSFQDVADGIKYAAKLGADIINLSLGAANVGAATLSVLQAAVDFARNLGSIVVAAAGNSNADVDTFSPANLNGVIAVGATDSADRRATFSNWGDSLFITAPGVDILSLGDRKTNIGTKVTNDYYRASGTSMAAPFVSGAIALILNKFPGASLDFVKSTLVAGAADLGAAGWDPFFGYGRLNIAASLGIASGAALTTGGSSGSGSTSTGFGAQSAEISVSGDGSFDARITKKRVEDEYGV